MKITKSDRARCNLMLEKLPPHERLSKTGEMLAMQMAETMMAEAGKSKARAGYVCHCLYILDFGNYLPSMSHVQCMDAICRRGVPSVIAAWGIYSNLCKNGFKKEAGDE